MCTRLRLINNTNDWAHDKIIAAPGTGYLSRITFVIVWSQGRPSIVQVDHDVHVILIQYLRCGDLRLYSTKKTSGLNCTVDSDTDCDFATRLESGRTRRWDELVWHEQELRQLPVTAFLTWLPVRDRSDVILISCSYQ